MAVAAKRKMTRAKVSKKATRPRTPRMADEKYTGPEPDWDNALDWTGEQYYRERTRTGQYYNYYYTPKDGKPWVVSWMKDNGYSKEDLQIVKATPDSWVPIIVCGYCRALSKGMPKKHPGVPAYMKTLAGVVGEDLQCPEEYVRNKIAEIIERGKNIKLEKKEDEKKKNVYRPSIQELLREKSVEMASEIDEFVDKFDYKPATLKTFDPLKLLRKVEAKGNHAKQIKSFYQLEWQEYDDLLNPPKRMTAEKKEDYEQLKEGYSHLKKAEIKAAYQMYQNILDACDMLVQESKVNRAPRKKKPVSKDKIVAKVKYCKQDVATKSVSIKPVDVLDASAIVVYNVRTRKLGIYYPEEYNNLSFKGTTLTGFDEKKSVQKTMRKPAEQVSQFKKVAKRSLQKQFSEVKSVETKMNGRFNEHTLILRVF